LQHTAGIPQQKAKAKVYGGTQTKAKQTAARV